MQQHHQQNYMPQRSQQTRRPDYPGQRSASTPVRNVGNARAPPSVDSESWIEVASNPSDNSSSDEHIITSGLRINSYRTRLGQRRRSNLHPGSTPPNHLSHPAAPEASTNLSQCDPDVDLSPDSSADEGEPQDVASFIATLPLSGASSVSAAADDEESSTSSASSTDDEARTVFASSGAPVPVPAAERLRQEEHDAALRASLSTLLSCAAAARGLPPKVPSGPVSVMRPTSAGTTSVEGLRVVRSDSVPSGSGFVSKSSSRSSSSTAAAKKRSARHKRLNTITTLQASLYTLAFSAGAIVVLSAISFSAGYWVGKEVARVDPVTAGAGRVARRVGRVAAA